MDLPSQREFWYDFEFEEVKNPTLQIAHDLELKWRCEQLKRIVQRETKEVSISQDVRNGIELNFIRAMYNVSKLCIMQEISILKA